MQTPITVTTGSTATDVTTAVATCFGALGTVGALLLALKLWRNDVARARRAQASTVHGYKDDGMYVVENNSNGAVYDVKAPRTGQPVVPLAGIIPVGGKAVAAVDDGEPERRGEKNPITFSFTDQAGVRWTRHRAGGRLEEVPNDL
ncbi:hypothetical protein [Streptacidiphilus jiangxiensis]|uniref:Uncharacterized protein n=1 Tax=Streptacidiphilus jiangxiensis TaxID=235985 RepID=A0A1H7WL34_STRJI|nr:hypothetical protein [Streptacidiphilus jiangxiensis]SEM21607.1 hypothetical protein SAMN05414137_120204 [Streptacidiphilus jiangxiensis]